MIDNLLDADTAVPLLLLALGLNIVIGLAGFALGLRRPAWARSGLIVQILVAAFFLLIVITPAVQHDAMVDDSPRLLSLAVFLGLMGLLKLLGRFEDQ